VNQHTARKPFVVPQIKEEASLAGITLISGCGPTRGHGLKKNKNFGRNTRRGYSFGRHT
jgi:hypothetical protein